MAPEISSECEAALAVWSAMGGWFPERLPVVLVMLGVTELDGLFDRLIFLRGAIADLDKERDG